MVNRVHTEYHLLDVDSRTLSTYKEWQGGPLRTFRAYYRLNTGLFKMERIFRAPDMDKAIELARAAIPVRKPRDIQWLILHKVRRIDDEPEELTPS